jgi:UDP-N-acetylglucosamine 2-epimerase
MEAGNRCFDDRVPEEVNRRIIDHSSTVLLPYTERSKENLVREGIERERIYITGNPIYEVLEHFSPGIDSSSAMQDQEVEEKGYFLATLHRAENVDDKNKLGAILAAFDKVAKEFAKPVLLSLHPRTAEKIAKFGIAVTNNVRLLKGMSFFDFVKLEKNAFLILTDSGTVQEECSILRVPNVTTRDVTERPETVECGSNIIGGTTTESIVSAVQLALASHPNWNPPEGYEKPNVAKTTCNVLLGHTSIKNHR